MTDFPRGLTVGTGWFTQIEYRNGQPQLLLGIQPLMFTGTGCPAWLPPGGPADVRALADALHVDADIWEADLAKAAADAPGGDR